MNLNLNKNDLGKILFVISTWALVAMIFISLKLTFIHIDEYFTMAILKFPILDVLKIDIGDVHPPLYYLILKVITKVLTQLNIQYNTFFVLRLVSIIPFALILLFSALVIRKEYGWLTVGIFTIGLSFLSQYFLNFILIRMYSFSIFFLLISFYCYKKVLDDSSKKAWILFTLFSVLGAYTHYYLGISVIIIYLFLLIFILNRKETQKIEFKKWILSVISGILLYSPWIITLLNQINKVHNEFWIKDMNFNGFISCLSSFATSETQLLAIKIIAIISLIIFTAILLKEYNNLKGNDNYVILTGISVFLLTLLFSTAVSIFYKPILIPRYLLPSSAVLWLSISILAGRIKNNKLLIISLFLIFVLCLAGAYDTMQHTSESMQYGPRNDATLTKINNNSDIIIINSQ